jgi:hypothetical protein
VKIALALGTTCEDLLAGDQDKATPAGTKKPRGGRKGK